MNFLKLSSLLFIITAVISCSKEQDSEGYPEPIAVLNPSTNPATTITGAPIKYKVFFTNDEHIDSVMTFLQIDSTGQLYKENLDSLVRKDVYPIEPKNNLRQIESQVVPWRFPPVGKTIYLTFWMRSKTKLQKKTVKLEVR